MRVMIISSTWQFVQNVSKRKHTIQHIANVRSCEQPSHGSGGPSKVVHPVWFVLQDNLDVLPLPVIIHWDLFDVEIGLWPYLPHTFRMYAMWGVYLSSFLITLASHWPNAEILHII